MRNFQTLLLEVTHEVGQARQTQIPDVGFSAFHVGQILEPTAQKLELLGNQLVRAQEFFASGQPVEGLRLLSEEIMAQEPEKPTGDDPFFEL